MSCPHGYPEPSTCLDCILDEGMGGVPEPGLKATSRPFPARFAGTCSACNFAIHEGQKVVFTNRDYVVHATCLPEKRGPQ